MSPLDDEGCMVAAPDRRKVDDNLDIRAPWRSNQVQDGVLIWLSTCRPRYMLEQRQIMKSRNQIPGVKISQRLRLLDDPINVPASAAHLRNPINVSVRWVQGVRYTTITVTHPLAISFRRQHNAPLIAISSVRVEISALTKRMTSPSTLISLLSLRQTEQRIKATSESKTSPVCHVSQVVRITSFVLVVRCSHFVPFDQHPTYWIRSVRS